MLAAVGIVPCGAERGLLLSESMLAALEELVRACCGERRARGAGGSGRDSGACARRWPGVSGGRGLRPRPPRALAPLPAGGSLPGRGTAGPWLFCRRYRNTLSLTRRHKVLRAVGVLSC